MDSYSNLLSFRDWDHELILLIGTKGIDDLVLKEMLLFPSFVRVKVYFSIWTNTDLHSNLLSFHDWAPRSHSPWWDK